jgi:hypothetical protein
LKKENNTIWLCDETGNSLIKPGDWLVLGGAFISASQVEKLTGQTLPEGISGPFWNANSDIEKK